MHEAAGQFLELRPSGGFKVILADPATEFVTRSKKGQGKSPSQHYPTMTIEQICALPVESLAAKDCALFFWTVWPLMPRWNEMLTAWGFKFSGLAWEWIKYNPKTGNYAFGPGYGSRKNLEPCLLATRGEPSLRKEAPGSLFGSNVIPMGVRSVRDFIEVMPTDCIREPRREHSRKPEEQYTRIETMFDGPYVELFARQSRSRWACWGNETQKFGEPE